MSRFRMPATLTQEQNAERLRLRPRCEPGVRPPPQPGRRTSRTGPCWLVARKACPGRPSGPGVRPPACTPQRRASAESLRHLRKSEGVPGQRLPALRMLASRRSAG